MTEKGMKCPKCGKHITHDNVNVLMIQEDDILVDCPDCDEFWTYTR